jgi:hypothetical protein
MSEQSEMLFRDEANEKALDNKKGEVIIEILEYLVQTGGYKGIQDDFDKLLGYIFELPIENQFIIYHLLLLSLFSLVEPL